MVLLQGSYSAQWSIYLCVLRLRRINFLKYAKIIPQMRPFGRTNFFSVHNEQNSSSFFSFIQKIKVFLFTRHIHRKSCHVTITGSIMTGQWHEQHEICPMHEMSIGNPTRGVDEAWTERESLLFKSPIDLKNKITCYLYTRVQDSFIWVWDSYSWVWDA